MSQKKSVHILLSLLSPCDYTRVHNTLNWSIITELWQNARIEILMRQMHEPDGWVH